jgi:hypothetical protein
MAMPMTNTPLPFGLRDVKLTPYTDGAATTLGTPVDLPNARTLSFTETEEFEELRGDDKVVASHGSGPGVEWELEAGGASFEAVRVMYGGTITESGTTPAQKKTYSKSVTDQRGYFKIEGQSISDSGGDFHCVIYKAKATDNLSGEMGDGSFWLTGASGVGLGSTATASIDKVWEWIQNETATAIPST